MVSLGDSFERASQYDHLLVDTPLLEKTMYERRGEFQLSAPSICDGYNFVTLFKTRAASHVGQLHMANEYMYIPRISFHQHVVSVVIEKQRILIVYLILVVYQRCVVAFSNVTYRIIDFPFLCR